ncbi:heterokaryon incompatibility protein-domain-containing protein [Podospora australis]|uniref:Heterokaryon incompatibility protein-domain-containing protein n=1 Tax=Podospora australis TaxID=1536484 RepID=A0AAN7ADR0_9PEZI|nr:heterokaryon incompatibility protein-domain-containing protein [Podospora australis]
MLVDVDLPIFKHDPLPQGRRLLHHIRLLKINSAIFLADVLDCELNMVSLNDEDAPPPQYDALSYCWSSAEDEDESADEFVVEGDGIWIIINGQRCKIGHSLAGAPLRYLRWKGKSEYIWADGICINQSDDVEKSAQVSIMDQIYRRASRCYYRPWTRS